MKMYLSAALAFFVCATSATAGSLTLHFNHNGHGRDAYGFSYSTSPRQQYGHKKHSRDDDCRRGQANMRKHDWRPRHQERTFVVKEYVPVYVYPRHAPQHQRSQRYSDRWD